MKRLLRADVRGALIEHPAHVRGQRHVGQQVAGKDALALIALGVAKRAAGVGELQVAAFELGEAQHLQGLGHRKQLVDFHLQIGGDFRQIGHAVVGRRGHRFDQARQFVGGHVRQHAADALTRERIRCACRWAGLRARAVIST